MYKCVVVEEIPGSSLRFLVRFVDVAGSIEPFHLENDTVVELEGDLAHPDPVRYRALVRPSSTRGGRELRLYSCSDAEYDMSDVEFKDCVLSAKRVYSVVKAGAARLAMSASLGSRTPIQYGIWALRDKIEAIATSMGLSKDSIKMVGDFSEIGEMRTGIVERPDGSTVTYVQLSDIPEGCFYSGSYGRSGGLSRSVYPGSTGSWLIRMACVDRDGSDQVKIPYRLYLLSDMQSLSMEQAVEKSTYIARSICDSMGIDRSRLEEYAHTVNEHARTCGPDLPWLSNLVNAQLRAVIDREPNFDSFGPMSAGALDNICAQMVAEIRAQAPDLEVEHLSAEYTTIKDLSRAGDASIIAALDRRVTGLVAFFPSAKVGRRYYLVRTAADVRNTCMRIAKMAG